MKMITALVVKPRREVEVIQVEDDYKAVKNVLGIESPVDCITRKIGGKEFDIWCDDEGLFKEELNASALCQNANEMITGTILICKNDDEKMASLSVSDIELIMDNIMAVRKEHIIPYQCSLGVLPVKFSNKGGFLVYEY